MSRFLTKFMLWTIIALFFACAMDIIITSGLRRTDIRKYSVWNDIYRGPIDADLVVIGSSRAWCAYNTYILDSLLLSNSYNLGIDGHSLEMQLVRYETYRRFNPAPRMIVMNTDLISTFSIDSDPQYEREQFFPFIMDRELVSRVMEKKRLTLLDRYCPIVRYYGYREDISNGIASFLGKKTFIDGGMHKGYRGNSYRWQEFSPYSEIDVRHVQIDTSLVTMLDDFVAKTRAEGLLVVFVKSPIYSPYLDLFDDVDVFDSILATIADKYGIPVLDYSRIPLCQDNSYFYNASHLNKRGSEIFTRMLCGDLAEITRGICEIMSRNSLQK